MIIAIKILMSGVGSSVNQNIRKKKKKMPYQDYVLDFILYLKEFSEFKY